MPEITGIKFLSQIKAMYSKTVRMILSGYSDITVVTDAINDGAVYRYLSKPWQEEELKEAIRNGLRHWRELYENNTL